MSAHPDVVGGVGFKLDQTQVQHILVPVLGKHHLMEKDRSENVPLKVPVDINECFHLTLAD